MGNKKVRGDAMGGTGANELLQELKKTEPEKVEQKEESKE